jgi:hypothetical protein
MAKASWTASAMVTIAAMNINRFPRINVGIGAVSAEEQVLVAHISHLLMEFETTLGCKQLTGRLSQARMPLPDGKLWKNEAFAKALDPTSGNRSFCAGASLHAVDPLGLHRFIGPKIDADFHRRRGPYELLSEFELERVFLLTQEPCLEISGGCPAA